MSGFVMARMTGDGRLIECELDPPAVWVDSRAAEVLRVDRYRDGGSQQVTFLLDGREHLLYLCRRLRGEHYETLDGERLEARQ